MRLEKDHELKSHEKNSSHFSLLNKTRRAIPALPFETIKNKALGASYTLSLVFVGNAESQRINKTYRNKEYIPNVLSFELDKTSGEVFINPQEAQKQAPLFDYSYEDFIGFLFIHALCHLKGMQHGSRMESTEKLLRKRFGFLTKHDAKKNSSGHRHRNTNDTRRRHGVKSRRD